MKPLIAAISMLLCFAVFGQDDWRDSLEVARKAYKNKEYGKALDYYQSAQNKAPESIDLSDEMAQSAYKARQFDRAEKIYQQGGGAKTSKAQKADNYHNLGNARMKQKNYQGAIDAYKESLRNNPNDENTRYNLSEAIRQLKNEQKQQQQQQENQQNQNQNQNQQNNQNGQNNQQNQQQQEQGQNQQNQNQQQGEGQQSKSKLPNQMVERELDKLAKKEAETKRKVSGGSGAGKTAKSGKDW